MNATLLAVSSSLLLLPGCAGPPVATGPLVRAGSNHASVVVRAADTIQAIASCPVTGREQLLANIRKRRQAGVAALQALGQGAWPQPPEHWGDALAAVEQRADELDRSLDEARTAPAESWPSLRLRLATLYTVYANAVIMAETAAYPEK